MVLKQPKTISSPLRYPGGKSSFYQYFSELIKQNGLDEIYVEPFAGGAGLALGLLSAHDVSTAILNDADYHIYCFWYAVLNHNERFIDAIQNIDLSIAEWLIQKAIYKDPNHHDKFTIGFSTFYLNRCNRSGILASAGPIGGYKQSGKWKLDARFNKESLMVKIDEIGKLTNRITIANMDAVDFLKQHVPRGKRKKTLIYADPPYVSAGARLYLNFYNHEDHITLANYLLKQTNLNWILTYDDNDLIRKAYCSCQQSIVSLDYSVQSKRAGAELIIAPMHLLLPENSIASSKRWHITERIISRRNTDGSDR